jgi:hypothetical protein
MSVIRRILNSTKALVSNSLPTTGSNTFVGTQTYSGSIIPAINNTYDLGSETKQFRHLYLSSGSLYIDGQKVLGSTGNELQITTDNGQSIKILEAGSDNIILQSADGNIELKTSGGGDVILDPTNGVIGVKGTMTIYSGNKLLSSDGNAIQFGNDLGITGSITTTGNVNGVNLSTLSSSLDTRIVTEKNRVDAILSAADADKDTFVEIVTLINSVDTSNDSTFASFYTASVNRLNNLETTSGSVNTSVSNLNTYTGSNNTTNTTQNSRLTSIESVTGSYETKGRSIVSGSSQITFSGISSLPTLVSGSSQITLSSTTGYGSVLNQAVLTTSSPTFAAGTFNGDISIGSGQNANIRMGRNANDWGEVQYSGGVTSLINGWASTSAYVQQQVNGQWTRLFGTGQIDQNRTSEGTFYRGLMNGNSRFTIGTDGSANVQIRTGNGVGLRLGVNEDAISIANGGNVTFSGTITENSSIRYKENVETIKYGLDKVLQMRGVTYDKKDNGVRETGVIAEEIYEVLPEVVLKNEEGDIDSVSYGRIVGVLIEAIKEQQKQIEELKSLIK